MKKIIFWGGTGQAKVLREALSGRDIELVAIFDNCDIPSPFNDVPLFIGEEGFEVWYEKYDHNSLLYFCVAIGGPHGKDRLEIHEQLIKKSLLPYNVIHPTAFVAEDVVLGDGIQILAQSAVCSNAVLGDEVIVNTSASVDHDTKVSDGVHIGPGAHIAGEVTIKEEAFIGAGSIVLPRLTIGQKSIVGAGAVVIKDVPPHSTVVGNPAKIISK